MIVNEPTFTYVTRLPSPLGEITLSSDGEALTGLWLEGQRFFARTLPATAVEQALPVFEKTKQWLDIYFRGEEPGDDPPIRCSGTPFQRTVWRMLRTIPYGKTLSYGELARRISEESGRASVSARAVGGAVARNPVAILIPCHRVLGANAALTGYAGGLDRKLWLLKLERAAL